MAGLSDNDVGIGDICTGVLGAVFAVISVASRLWSRSITRHSLGWSDVTIILALIFALGLVAISICSVVYAGAGLSTAELQIHFPGKLSALRKYLFYQNIVWVTANTLVRVSILLLYIDIFPVRTFVKVCYGFLALNVSYWLEVILLRLLVCIPMSYNWDTIIAHGACRGTVTHAAYINGVFNILMDICTVLLPMPILWTLKMATGKKLALSFIFGLGILICVLSILRVEFLHQTEKVANKKTYVAFGSLAVLEPLLGIVNACMPFFRPIFLKVWPGKARTTTGISEYRESGSSRAFRHLEDGDFTLENSSGTPAKRARIDVYQPRD